MKSSFILLICFALIALCSAKCTYVSKANTFCDGPKQLNKIVLKQSDAKACFALCRKEAGCKSFTMSATDKYGPTGTEFSRAYCTLFAAGKVTYETEKGSTCNKLAGC